MRKPQYTKEKIIKESSILFNTKGYKTTSLSDITNATGFTKGAIYKHFENKDVLEMEAFENMFKQITKTLLLKIKKENNSKNKLFAILDFFETYITHPFIKGGCPILNVAIEFDNTNSPLKDKGRIGIKYLKDSVIKIITNGKKHNQIDPNLNEENFAILFIASIEGSIMMSNLNNNSKDINIVSNFLRKYIEEKIIL
ncbi:TetR/AcrR family transcriptional regulator [Flavobacterium sp. HNIBRBA15423]|uniref:TetR/AcrR family transcriptional regulator n=1 Tax=Flavobacterium sp. HNIBRBA15423 TaxID=3458683 RepID=UPI00404452E6